MWLVGEEILKKRLGPLLEAGQAKFAIHVEIEDCWYSCPKAENYCNSERSKTCTCGKDDWDKALRAGKTRGKMSEQNEGRALNDCSEVDDDRRIRR